MSNQEINTLIIQLEAELSLEEERYANAIKTGKDYKTLRALRDKLHLIELEIETLYSKMGTSLW
jgi:hypothetical protein